jgi:hypothetical protein
LQQKQILEEPYNCKEKIGVEDTLPAEAPDLPWDGWKRSRSGGRWRSSPQASLLVASWEVEEEATEMGLRPLLLVEEAAGGRRGWSPEGGGGGRGAEARRREAAPQTIHNTKSLNKCCRYHQIGKVSV